APRRNHFGCGDPAAAPAQPGTPARVRIYRADRTGAAVYQEQRLAESDEHEQGASCASSGSRYQRPNAEVIASASSSAVISNTHATSRPLSCNAVRPDCCVSTWPSRSTRTSRLRSSRVRRDAGRGRTGCCRAASWLLVRREQGATWDYPLARFLAIVCAVTISTVSTLLVEYLRMSYSRKRNRRLATAIGTVIALMIVF